MAFGKRNFGETVPVDRSNDASDQDPALNRHKRQKVNGGKPDNKRVIDVDGSIKKMLPENTVQSALKALYESTDKANKKRTQKLKIEDDEINTDNISYFLKLTWTTPPKKDNLRPTALPLKHSLAKDDDQVILFVKDPQRAVKDYFEQHGHGGVTRILGVEKLRKRYGTFEARRELMGMYDRFLVDKRVAPMMPRLLGKAFIDSKKMPLVVDLSHDATAAVRRALASTKYTPRRGTSCAIQFGTQSLTTEQLAENLETVMRGLLEKFSRGVDHGLRGRETIQSVSIKTDLSPALPLYVTLPSVIGGGKPKSDTMQQEKKTENTKNKKAGELATTGKAENEDSENGDDQNVGDGVSDNDDDVKLEVQYTDGEDDDDVDDDDDGEEEEEDKLVDDGSKIDADSTRKDENKVIKPEGKSKKGAKPKKVITKSNNNKPKHKAGPQRRKGNHGRGVGKSPRKADKKGHGSEDSGDKENDAPGGTKKTTPSNKKQVLGNGESNKTSNRPLIKRNAGAQKKTPRAASADRRKPKTVRKR